MIVIDTSVWIDLFIPKNEKRNKIAKHIFHIIEENEIEIYAPKLFVIEFISIMKRLVGIVPLEILDKINLIDEAEIFEILKDVAFKTSSRASDAYFIATAKLTNSILITNDKIMNENAKKYGIESYYLIEEFEKVEKRIKEMK